MASSQLSAADESRAATTDASAGHLTLGWFARRSALWLLSVAAGIGAACFIYAYAEESTGAELASKTAAIAAQQPAKTP